MKKKSSMVSLDPDGLNVEVGDQVLVAGQKNGIVRFYGKTDFAPGASAVRHLLVSPTLTTLCTSAVCESPARGGENLVAL